MTRLRRAAVWAAVVMAAIPGSASAQDADPAGAELRPSVKLDRAAATPGDRILVTLEGFEGPAVVIAVCGNLAGHGSADCNMVRSQGLGVSRSGPVATEFVVSAPPTPCPCVIRVTATSLREAAVAAIELAGHPVTAVAEPAAGPLLSVSMTVRRAPVGLGQTLRAGLGGPTPYAIDVIVRNTSASTLEGVVLSGSAGRGNPARSFPVPDPGPIAPGAELRITAPTLLPAPAVGKYQWEVTASGAGLPVRAAETTKSAPLLLVALSAGLAVDALAFARRRARRRAGAAGRR